MATIDHVIVLVLENRSFDHMLGYLAHPDPDFDGLAGSTRTNPAWHHLGPPVPSSADAKWVMPLDPDHSHDAAMEQLAIRGRGARRRATNEGYVASLERKGRGLAPPAFEGLLGPAVSFFLRWSAGRKAAIKGRGGLAMRCQPPAQVPVLARLALEFTVCTRWFASVPGETWPNRNYLHAATSAGTTDIELRFYQDPTIFERLEEHGRSWRIYYDDTPQVWAFSNLWDREDRIRNWFPFSAFAGHVASGSLPAYCFIEPNQRPPLHTPDHLPVVGSPSRSSSQHPGNNGIANDAYDAAPNTGEGDFARAERLIAEVYESLRANPDIFERSVLLVTYDEQGGLYDHVPPPMGVPPPGTAPVIGWPSRLLRALLRRKSAAFDFTMLGGRVPAVVISPFVPAGVVDRTTRDHASVPSTLRAVFDLGGPLTGRDGWSPPFHTALTLDMPRRGAELPDLSSLAWTPAPGAAAVAPGATATASPPEVPDRSPPPGHYADLAELARMVGERLAPASPVPAHLVAQEFNSRAHRARTAPPPAP